MTDSVTLTGRTCDQQNSSLHLVDLGDSEKLKLSRARRWRSPAAPGCRRNPSYLTLVRGS
eukprot:COSAG03_NODE_1362_length_4256_cov_28.088044_4_plen_60_part_00